jgi:hypothetical protein
MNTDATATMKRRSSGRSQLRVIAAIAALMAAVPDVARAQGQPSPAAVREASERFQRGIDLTDEGNYSAALTEFQRAYALTQNALVLFNLSATHEALGHFVEALDLMGRFEREAPAPAVRERRALVDGALARLRGRIGTLLLETDTPGAELLLDGIARPIGEARVGMRLDAGRHRVTVRAPGHVAREEIVDVVGGASARIAINLARVQSSILVRCNVARAEVRVDGVVVGRTPMASPILIGEGRRVVEVTRDGYAPFRQEVTAAGLGAEVRARLSWDPALDANTGARARIRATEPNITASIDGRRVSTDGRELVPPGVHVVRVEHRDFLVTEREVELLAGVVSTVDFSLAPVPAFRDEWMRDAHASRRNGWIVGGAGAAVTVGGAVFLAVRGVTYGTDLSSRDSAERAVQMCGGCVNGMALASALADARDRVTVDEILMGVAGGVTAVGVAGVITGALLLRNAPALDRFERRPMVWVLPGRGLGLAASF